MDFVSVMYNFLPLIGQIPILSGLTCWIPFIVAVVYPAMKTAEAWNNDKFDKKTHTQWMVYWVIAGVYTYLKAILFLDYIPFLWVVETVVAVWLIHPHTLGALYLHAVAIDDLFNNVIEKQVAPPLKNILSKIPL